MPDPETFPAEDLRLAFAKVFSEQAELGLQYGPEQGFGPLIDYLLEKVSRDEGHKLDRSRIKLSAGASQALDHFCSLYAKPGDTVIVEAPTYHEALLLFGNHGLRPLQIPVDSEGMDMDRLEKCLINLKAKGIKPSFIYTIPSFQNPSGITLSQQKRMDLLTLAEGMDLRIVDDDVYCDLAYENSRVPSLYTLDGGRRVTRLGSFSKIVAPGLRLGWILGPPEVIERLVNSGLRHMGGGANPLTAIAMSSYCQRGNLDPHIGTMRHVYKKRRDVMLDALDAFMPGGVSWTRPGGGFFIWMTLPPPLQAKEIKKAAEDEKILLLAGDPFFAEPSSCQYLRLSFSYVPEREIKKGIKKLAAILRSRLA